MAQNILLDLTNKNPRDTYQRIVQHDSGKYYDGIGNLLELATKTMLIINGEEVRDELLEGNTDFFNTEFTTANNFIPRTTRVFLNGVRQQLDADYIEVDDNQINFFEPPFAGAEIRCDYNVEANEFSSFNGKLIGDINGVNAVFSTFHNYLYTTTRIYLNGIKLRAGVDNDYIEMNNNQIVFAEPPWLGAEIIIEYKIKT